MAPIKGVVIEDDVALVIRLRDGVKVRLPLDERFVLGDPVWILYDFTKGCVRELWTEQQFHDDGDPGCEPVEVDLGPNWISDAQWLCRAGC